MPMPRIAVVDNDRSLRDLMQSLFEEREWVMLPYADESAVLAALKEDQPDVILLDLWLDRPGSGWEILQHLKSDGATRAIPIVVISGAPELADKEDWLAERGISTLAKPFEIDDLYTLVDSALTNRVPILHPEA